MIFYPWTHDKTIFDPGRYLTVQFSNKKFIILSILTKNLRRRIDSPTPHSKLQIVNRMYCNTQPITFYSILHSITAHKEEYHNVLLTVFEGSYVSW